LRAIDPAFVKYSTHSDVVLSDVLLSDAARSLKPGRKDIALSILRLDLTTQWAMGNKYFKLTGNIEQLVVDGVQRVLSFGGAWSNHLLALAQTAQAAGIQSVGVVRGEEGVDNEMLARMRSHGMHLHFISRSKYKLRHQPEFCENLCRQLQCDSWLPEGGANGLAITGCEMIADLITCQQDTSRVICAVGTGATLAGIIRGCGPAQRVSGIQVVNDTAVSDRINNWVGDCSSTQWSLHKPLHRSSQGSEAIGSYAKPSQQLLEFIVLFYKTTGIALDPVYTGPAMSTALSAEFLDAFASSERVVFVHTGGLAGVAGFNSQFDRCADQSAVKKYRARVQALVE